MFQQVHWGKNCYQLIELDRVWLQVYRVPLSLDHEIMDTLATQYAVG
jgi:hypothetical protein